MISPRIVQSAWILWLAAVVFVALPWFQFHARIFQAVDPALHRLLLFALPAIFAAGALWCKVRARGLWRYEFAALLALPLVLGAVYAPLATLVAVWLTVAAFGLGAAALHRLGLPHDSALSLLTGLGLLSWVLFFLGIAGAYYPWTFALLLLAATAAGRAGIVRQFAEFRRWNTTWRHSGAIRQPAAGAAVFAAFLLTGLACLTWLTPAWNGDSIRFHIPLVRSYLSTHSLAVPNAIPYGYFPQGFEVLATLAYSLGGPFAAQAIGPLAFLAALLAIYSIAKSCEISLPASIAGLTLGAAIPFIHWSGADFKNDLLMAACQLGALLAYLRWRQDRNFRWIVAGTFLIAMSFAVKHVAVFAVPPFALLYLHALWRQPRRVFSTIVLATLFAASGLIWHARTYAAKHSLVYPSDVRSAVSVPRPDSPWYLRALRFVEIPLRIHTDGRQQFESPSTQPAGIVLFLCAPLWLLRPRQSSQRRTEFVLWLFILLYYLYWASILSTLRYAIAPILLLPILAAARLDALPRRWAPLFLGAAFLFSLPVLIILEMAPAQIPFFLMRSGNAAFLRATLRPFPAVEQLNRHASATDPVASLGNWAAAYAPNPALFLHVYHNDPTYTPDELRPLLQPSTRFLILPNSPNRLELERAAESNFLLQPLHQDQAFLLYRLTPR